MDEYDPSFHWPESRIFSIANSPTRREKIRITFSVKGKYTRRMFDEVKEDDIVWLKLPYGGFMFPAHENEIFLIAGGTGITPFVSFLEYAIDKKINTKINLYYGVRSPEYLIFGTLLEECGNNLNEFCYHVYIERDCQKCNLNNVKKGILSIETIFEGNNNKPDSIYYLSGPQQMIDIFRGEMIQSEIMGNNIIVDKWE